MIYIYKRYIYTIIFSYFRCNILQSYDIYMYFPHVKTLVNCFCRDPYSQVVKTKSCPANGDYM